MLAREGESLHALHAHAYAMCVLAKLSVVAGTAVVLPWFSVGIGAQIRMPITVATWTSYNNKAGGKRLR